jgi:hypothetical protein
MLHRLVLLFGVTVILRVDGCRESVIDVQVRSNSIPKSTGELSPGVSDDLVRNTSFADLMFASVPTLLN